MSMIVRQDDVRRQNQFGVMMALRRHGAMSRTELSLKTGLSASTVTVITNSLIEHGALEAETVGEMPGSRRGRPQVLLSPSPKFASVAVLFLGLNLFQVVVADYAGTIQTFEARRIPTRELSSQELMKAVADLLTDTLTDLGDRIGPLKRLSIGVEGIVDARTRTLLSTPLTHLRNIPVGKYLEEHFQIPVEISNESNMIAEALHWRAPERYGDNFATVLLSMGIGMGLFLNGKMFSGVHSSAVEFGHTNFRPDGALCRCGRKGCIEAYAGTYSLWRSVCGVPESELLHEDPPENALEIMIERARDSDGPERRAFAEAGKAVGTGLSNVFTMFDPIPLVFTGPGVKAMDLMSDGITEALSRTCFGQPVPISVIDTYEDYRALIREGSLMRALVYLDRSSVSAGERHGGEHVAAPDCDEEQKKAR